MAGQIYPEPTAGTLIFNPAGEMLLLKSDKWKGKYVIPGGHIELGERADEAARREAKEETGLDVEDLEFLCWQEFVYDDAFWKPMHFIFLDFICKTKGTQVILNDEAQAYRWAKPEEALTLPIDAYTAVSIREYLKRKKG
jgi:nucleoside triphosphatase